MSGPRAFVTIVRHPDYGNDITVQGNVDVIDIDLGSGFDGHPRDPEEAEYARELAFSVEQDAMRWPNGPARDAALGMVRQLRELADDV